MSPAQFTQEEIAPPAGSPLAPAGNRVRIFPRSGGRWNFRTFIDETQNERVVVVNSGVQLNIEGLDQLGSVTLETDRIVIWLPNSGAGGGGDFSQMFQSGDGPMEIYMEGNIVFRQGDRVIYADRMYYNVRQDYGVVLKAEMLTPVPQYQGMLRLKAEVLQQVDRQHFEAYGAALTSSRIGVPRYWFQTQSVTVDDLQTPIIDPFTGQPLVDPQTGEPVVNHQMLATSRNNCDLRRGRAGLLLAGDRDRPLEADILHRPDRYQERPRLRHAGVSRFRPVSTAGHRKPAAGDEVDPFDRLSQPPRPGPGDQL